MTKELTPEQQALVDDGWTLHFGGECPIPNAKFGDFEVQLSGEGEPCAFLIEPTDWVDEVRGSSVIAYRLIPAKPDREAAIDALVKAAETAEKIIADEVFTLYGFTKRSTPKACRMDDALEALRTALAAYKAQEGK